MITETFDLISKTAKLIDKKKLISKLDSNIVNQILVDTYDKSVSYGITTKNLKPSSDWIFTNTIDENYQIFHSLLEDLAARKITGNEAINTMSDMINSFRKEDRKLLMDIIDRSIAIGFTWDAWQKFTGKKVVKFEVPLALHLNKVKNIDPMDGTYFASRKMDGCRLLIKADLDTGEIIFYSRSGKEYKTLSNLKPSIINLLKGRSGVWALDGECAKMLPDGKDDFQGVMKEITRKNYTISKPHFYLFDLVPWDVFVGDEISDVFSVRYSEMQKLPTDPSIILLEQEKITSAEIFEKWADRVSENNWEGFMLRKDVPFKTGRSRDLLKYKPFVEDFETRVIRTVNGQQVFAVPGEGNKLFDGVKYLVIQLSTGDEVHVGTGLSKEQRTLWFQNPDLIVGKVITVKYLEKTIDQNGKHSLRHPILKWVHGEERDT